MNTSPRGSVSMQFHAVQFHAVVTTSPSSPKTEQQLTSLNLSSFGGYLQLGEDVNNVEIE
ncbi:hypothetical protein [Nostoc sp.]|uniref:hypothetical protein n=1 Tax=Nostoc sp. TaxID=1180 RepID=UPI002FF88CCA